MKHESKMDAQEAGAASRNNKRKVSSEDDPNTNDTDAPLNSTGSPTTDSADEVWDIVRVFEDPNDACECRTEECKSKAVVAWAATSDPTEEWPLCEECQEKDFGGWPENITPPAYIQSKLHNTDEEMPDPRDLADDKEPDEVATAEECDLTKVTESNDNNGKQGDEMEEVWDVKKVMSIADVNDCPIKCSTETCTLAAACVYISNLAPAEKWYTCLDCQVSNMGGKN